MRRRSALKPLLGWLAVLVLCVLNANAGDAALGAYSRIVERNVFGLKPSAPAEPKAPPPQAPKLTLTGVAQFGARKFALITEEHNRVLLSHVLVTGQKEGDLEILKIETRPGRVLVRQGGMERTLLLSEHRDDSQPQPEGQDHQRPYPFPPGEVRADGV